VSKPDSLDDPDEKPQRAAVPSARNQAMNWLARREYAQGELRTRLATRDFAPEAIEAAVAGLVADGLVSDERFAEGFVASRVRNGKGPVRIRMELKQRGVDTDTIHAYLDAAGFDWHSLAREVRGRKFGEGQPKEFKEKARQMRFLEYRGFTGEQINAALDED
jgi:regulatory protein